MNFIYGTCESYEAGNMSSHDRSNSRIHNLSGIKVSDKNTSMFSEGLIVPGESARPSKKLFGDRHYSHSHKNSEEMDLIRKQLGTPMGSFIAPSTHRYKEVRRSIVQTPTRNPILVGDIFIYNESKKHVNENFSDS